MCAAHLWRAATVLWTVMFTTPTIICCSAGSSGSRPTIRCGMRPCSARTGTGCSTAILPASSSSFLKPSEPQSPTGAMNIALLELVARTRDAIAGHPYQGDGIKRLDVLGNLTNKFMRTYTMQVEALARKRRKGEQNVTVKHVHIHSGAQAVVGVVNHRRRRGGRKNGAQAHEREPDKPAALTISERPSMRSADQERQALPVPGDQEGAMSIARRRSR
jgi:hypothetical protein